MPDIAPSLAAQAAADGADVQPGQTNTVAPCGGPPRKIQIGIFFDGTGNYLDLDRMEAEKAKGWKESPQQRDALYEAALQASRDEQHYRTLAEQLRREQAAWEREAQVRENRAIAYGGMEEGLEALGWPDTGRRQADAWDQWREAKSTAARKAAEAQEAEARAAAARKQEQALARERSRMAENTPASPDQSSPSNVAKLFLLYPSEAKDIYAIYVRGVGTVQGAVSQKEYTALGQGLAMGSEGGEARILEAKKQVLDLLQKFDRCGLASVTIDVFGFSRGAALARHFVNVILDGLPDFKKPLLTKQRAKYLLGALRVEPSPLLDGDLISEHQPLPNVTIRFVGLFDTVGSFYWPGNSDEGEFKLELPQGCAKKVVHLIAADERRKNFRYTDIGGVGEEIVMEGVHSDIGGGYPLLEKIFLVMDKEIYAQTLLGNQAAQAERKLMRRAQAQGVCTENVLNPGYFFKHQLISSPYGGTTYQQVCYLLRTKMTDGRYSRVPLRIMYNKALEAGVPFTLPDESMNAEWYMVPQDLSAFVGSPPPSLEQALWEKYQHVSAVDMQPVEPYAQRAVGYYTLDIITQMGMKLDKNPLEARIGFSNKKPQQ